MNDLSSASTVLRPTRVRYGVLGFACVLSMITYLDRVCFGTVGPYIQHEFGLAKWELGLLFTGFTLSYAAFEVPSGWLGDLYGARRTLIRIVLWWSTFTALTGAIYPSPARPIFAFICLFLVRFLFGMGEAGAYPNISRAFANWFPFGERGSAQGAVWMAGRFAGGVSPLAVLVLVYTSTAPDGDKVHHWRHIFWIFGGLGVLWCIAFSLWFRDRPEQHPAVNPAELALIRGPVVHHAAPPKVLDAPPPDERILPEQAVSGLAESAARPGPVSPEEPAAPHDEHSHRNVPWDRFLRDGNLWLLCLMYFCAAYGWYFNITWLPTYLKEAGVTEETHGVWVYGLLAGMPLLVGSLACLVGGLLTDYFIKRTGNRKVGRRLFGAIGHALCALCYFMTLFFRSPWLFVLFLALAAFWNDLTMGSAWASCIDIGGKYAGIVSGCMNTVGNLGGAVAGVSGGLVIDLFGKETGWTINLVSFALAYVLASLFWLRFDATRQVAQAVEPAPLND